MSAISTKTNDNGQIAFDLNFAGNILLEAGRYDDAAKKFKAQVDTTDKADVPAENKEAAHRNTLYDEARIAIGKNDLATAKAKAKEYDKQVAVKQRPFEVRQAHELDGMVAMAAKDWKTAIAEFNKANQRDPRVIYLTALAYQGAGDAAKTKATAAKAADFNELALNLGFVRGKAKALTK